MDFDSVLLVCDGFSRSHRKGKAVCLKEDNNFVIGHLLGRGIDLAALCVIRDGCAEGGNYECILGPSSIGEETTGAGLRKPVRQALKSEQRAIGIPNMRSRTKGTIYSYRLH